MPIYAYKCASCGHERDVLQKLSDPVLTTCPACGASSFSKQITAAGFQLKGSGWYVTDFRNKGGPAQTAENRDKPADKAAVDSAAKTDTPASVPAAAPAPEAGGG